MTTISPDLNTLVAADNFEVSVRNLGTKPLVLVEPGDGSNGGLRTPVVAWSVQDDGGPVSQSARRFDSLINPPRPDQVFELQPNERQSFRTNWMGPVMVAKPGPIQVTLHYTNDPRLKWTGHEIGRSAGNSAVMKLIHGSTYCGLTSDPVNVVVRGARE